MAVMNMNCSQFGNNPYVRETTKVSEIKDRFGNTRFKVAFTDYDQDGVAQGGSKQFGWNYRVMVSSYCRDEEPVLVVCRDFDIYENAIRFFNDMTKQYAYLVRAETRDIQDIRIYAKRTGYHIICPDCCATCRWARPCSKDNCLFDDWKQNLRGKFVCMNSDLYAPPQRDLDPDCGQHDGYHDYQRERFHVIDIHPVVDAMGLCTGFERKADEKYWDPSHSERRFRTQDMSPDNRLETIAKYEVRQQMKDVETDITKTAVEAIDQHLQHDAPVIEGNRNLDQDVSLDGGDAD